jgi:hypothetical protein
MKVTVLGCGPAGLAAAHGVLTAAADRQMPVDLAIVSRKVRSPLYGCQYLHRPIPYMPRVHSTTVSYRLRGSADGYRSKVYGPNFFGTVSPEDLGGEHKAWDIRESYMWLWKKYQHLIIDGEVTPRTIWSLDGLIINSIPRDALCHQGHSFESSKIIAAGDAPDMGIYISNHFQCDDDSVVCNGEETPSWYRISRVFGHTTVEWPASLGTVPVTSAATVRKPTTTDCNCHPEVIHVGRYGRWQKGVLSHTAYWDAYREASRAMRGEEVAATQEGA